MNNQKRSISEIMSCILKYRSEIYGFLAVWIILFHISSRVKIPGNPRVIGSLIEMGNVGVDIFLFISGYCIASSLNKNNNLIRFYKRRLTRIVIPYLILGTPLYIWKNFIETHGKFQFIKFIKDITTYSFWTAGMQTTWYVCGIFFFYLLAPLLFFIAKKGKRSCLFLLIGTYALIVLFHFIIPGYSHVTIAWTRLPVFELGIILSVNQDTQLDNRILTLCKTATILLAVIFPVREWYKEIVGPHAEFLWLSYILIVPGFLIYLYEFLHNYCSFFNGWLKSLGSLSLELYIIHVFLLRIFDFFEFTTKLDGRIALFQLYQSY